MDNLVQAERSLTAPAKKSVVVGIAHIFSGWSESLLPGVSTAAGHAWEIRTGTSEEILKGVNAGAISAGLVRTNSSLYSQGLVPRELYQDPLLPVGRPDILRALPARSMTSWPWIGFSLKMGHGEALRHALNAQHILLTSHIVVDSLISARSLILAGRGIAVLPQSMVAGDLDAHALEVVSTPKILWPARTVALICADELPPSWLNIWGQRIAQQLKRA